MQDSMNRMPISYSQQWHTLSLEEKSTYPFEFCDIRELNLKPSAKITSANKNFDVVKKQNRTKQKQHSLSLASKQSVLILGKLSNSGVNDLIGNNCVCSIQLHSEQNDYYLDVAKWHHMNDSFFKLNDTTEQEPHGQNVLK